MAEIGIALFQRLQRHPVETQQHHFGREGQGLHLPGQIISQRAEIIGMVMIRRHKPQGRLPAHLLEHAGDFVKHGRGGGGAVLRIHRRDQDAVTPLRRQRGEPAFDRGIAIAHGPIDLHSLAEPPGHRLGLPRGDIGQRRSPFSPDLGIGLRAFLRAGVQDDPAQDQLPGNRRDLNHPRVRQKLFEIAPDRIRIRPVRRAKVDQQNANQTAAYRRVIARKALGLPGHCRINARQAFRFRVICRPKVRAVV